LSYYDTSREMEKLQEISWNLRLKQFFYALHFC
jgi:hypothetical protein